MIEIKTLSTGVGVEVCGKLNVEHRDSV
jgi:hypothetical protein